MQQIYDFVCIVLHYCRFPPVGNFSRALPGYQRAEVMAFIAAKIPGLDMSGPGRQSSVASSAEDLDYRARYDRWQ